MTDTQQLPAPPPPGRPPAHRRRGVIVAVATVAALVVLGALVTLVRSGTGDPAATAPPAGPNVVQKPSTRSADEAAVRGNWPMLANDEFDGTTLDPTYWNPYTGKTTDGVGRHRAENLSVSDGMLTITSHGKESGGLSWEPGQLYGRWEVRARSQVGTGYGPVLLLWPDAEDWPAGGEVDFMEIPKPERTASHFTVHYGADNSQNSTDQTGDFTQWHNYAVELTPDHVAGFLDGKEIFRTTDKDQLPPRPMHLGIQQDIGPYGTDWIPALDDTTPPEVKFQVDWVRIYSAQ